MTKMSMEQIVEGVNDLPALPGVTVQVMRIADDPKSTAQDMNAAISQDQAITAKVLKLANSAFYGFARRISSLTEATVMLGFKTVKSIVLAASVSDMMAKEVTGYALAPGELWRHSYACAVASRLIARKVKYPLPDVAYTAGLLHDIGKVILNHHLETAYQEVVDSMDSGGMTFLEAEKSILGFTHADVGSRVGHKWNLPAELVEAIALHHNPEEASVNPSLTAIIHVADALCLMMGIGIGIDGLSYPLSEKALGVLGLQPADMEELVSALSDFLTEDPSFVM